MNDHPKSVIKVGDRKISLNDMIYFIAEIESNFDGDLSVAKNLTNLTI